MIEVYNKAIVEYDCNRKRQNVVYDFVQNCKIKKIITLQRGQNNLLHLQKCVQHVISFSFAANMK